MKAKGKSLKSSVWDIPGLEISRTQVGWPRNTRQIQFVVEYVMNSKTAVGAAKAAGYSEDFSQKLSFQLPRRLAECITWLRGYKETMAEEKLGVTAEATLGEVTALAMLNWQDYLIPIAMHDGTTRMYGKPISELSPMAARGVQRFEMRTLNPYKPAEPDGFEVYQPLAIAGDVPIVVYDYVLFNRNENLVHLARHFDMFHEKRQRELPATTQAIDIRNLPPARLERFLTQLDALVRNDANEAMEGEFVEKGRVIQ